jgi:hypothetical protein
LAGGLNSYGFAAGDPINFSDPFGLSPACLVAPQLCWAGAAAVVRGVVALGAMAGALYADHQTALGRVERSLEIVNDHLADAASGPPDGGEDPNWLKDKLDDARKHINNAKRYVKDAIRGSKTRREAERAIQEADRAYQEMVRQLPPT